MAPVAMCAETLVSPQLSARATAVMCIGLEEYVIEDLSIIKVALRNYLCIYVYFIISGFTICCDMLKTINHEKYLIDA